MDDIDVIIAIPEDLLQFAQACSNGEDISACVVVALDLLRSNVLALAENEDGSLN